LRRKAWGDVEHDAVLGTSSMVEIWPSSTASRTARVGMGSYLHTKRGGAGGTLEVAMATVTSGRNSTIGEFRAHRSTEIDPPEEVRHDRHDNRLELPLGSTRRKLRAEG
jgi:hypothetical protein